MELGAVSLELNSVTLTLGLNWAELSCSKYFVRLNSNVQFCFNQTLSLIRQASALSNARSVASRSRRKEIFVVITRSTPRRNHSSVRFAPIDAAGEMPSTDTCASTQVSPSNRPSHHNIKTLM